MYQIYVLQSLIGCFFSGKYDKSLKARSHIETQLNSTVELSWRFEVSQD